MKGDTTVSDTDRVDLFRVYKKHYPGGAQLCAYHAATSSFLKMVYDLHMMGRIDILRGRLSANGGLFIEKDGEPILYMEHYAQRMDAEPNKMVHVLAAENNQRLEMIGV